MLERVWKKRESSCTGGGNANWYSHCGEQYGDSLKKKQLGIKLPYDPVILRLDIYSEKTINEKATSTPMLIVALFITAKTRMQPTCPLADDWKKKLWYIHTMERYSGIKRNAIESALVRWMDPEPIIQSEESQKEKQISYINTYMWNLEKVVLMNLSAGQE